VDVRRNWARRLTAVALGVGLVLAGAASAQAANKPVNIGTPYESGPPAVTVDSGGNAVVAWANTKDLAGAANFVQYCVLPVGATMCKESGSLIPADSAQYIDGVQVLVEGGTYVILADVYGTAGNDSRDYIPEQEWQSTDGGGTWTIIDNGLSVTNGIIDADTAPLSAVTVPGSGVLGYGWNTAGGSPPTFNAFPLSSPPECSTQTCAAGYASLEPASNPDQIGNAGGQFASSTSSKDPGVLAIFNTLFTNGPLACTQSFGTAYAFGSGDQSASNNYNLSPGQAGSAWVKPVTQADCNVEYPAVAGGPAGYGVLETDLGNNTTVYHPFDLSNDSFDTKLVKLASDGEEQPGLSMDAGRGVYATYLLGGVGGPIDLSYSPNGGSTWATAAINADKDGGISNQSNAVNGTGQGWSTWTDNGSVFAEPFTGVNALCGPAVGSKGSSNGKTAKLTLSCSSYPAKLAVALTATKKGKTIKLGAGTFSLAKKSSKSVTLSGPGKSFIKSHPGHVKVTADLAERLGSYSVGGKHAVTLKVSLPSSHHHT